MNDPRGIVSQEPIGFQLESIKFNPEDIVDTELSVKVYGSEYKILQIEWIAELFRRIAADMGAINRNFKKLTTQINTSSGRLIAWARIQLTEASELLESSDDPSGTPVPRSVVTVTSQSPVEFNFLFSGFTLTYVTMGPGAGAVSHHVIVDLNDDNNEIERKKALAGAIVPIASSVFRPYGMSGTKLQLCEIAPGTGGADNQLKVYPKSISFDTWLYCEQTLPMISLKV
jgi:hypothetical protein